MSERVTMLKIEGKLRQELVEFLSQLEILHSIDGVSFVLKNAGAGNLVSRIKISGSPRIYIGNLIDFLADWGNIQGQEVLVLFLQALYTEIGNDKQNLLEQFIQAVRSKTVIFPSLQRPVDPSSTLPIEEKLIGEPTLLPIAFLETAIKLAKAVSFIELNTDLGTGFMISNNLLLTCNHVIPTSLEAETAAIRFNYQYNNNSGIGPTEDYHKKKDGVFYTNPELDFSVLELEGEPGQNWGQVKLSDHFKSYVKVDERVNIIQHPGGRPKQISFRNNFVDYIDDTIIQYVTHTEPGSSGSPVFNDSWELVALHHAGGNVREPSTQRRYYRNEGIAIKSIYNALPDSIRELI